MLLLSLPLHLISSKKDGMAEQVSSANEGDLRKLAIREARRDGVFAALTSGLTGAILGSKLLGLNRNKAVFCGVLTGLLSGYFFTQAFEASNISRIKSTAVPR